MGLTDTGFDEVEQTQFSWYDHMQRMLDHRTPNKAMNQNFYYKRKCGRPKITWNQATRRQ